MQAGLHQDLHNALGLAAQGEGVCRAGGGHAQAEAGGEIVDLVSDGK